MYGEEGARFQPVDRWGGFGNRGLPVALTYSFPEDGLVANNCFGQARVNQLHARLNGIYGDEATWKQIFANEFERWSEKTGVIYTEVADDNAGWGAQGPFNGSSGRGDIRIVMGDNGGPSGVLACNSFPDNGDMFLDVDENWGSNTFFRNVITHEHGHGMGLAHTCPALNGSIGGFPILMKPFIDTGFLGPQFDDSLSGQFLYGDRFEPNTTGPSSVNLPGMGQTNNGVPFTVEEVSLHSDNDLDLFRFENFGGTEISVFLAPIGPTYFQGPQNGGGGSGCVGNSGGEFVASAQGDLQFEILEPNFSQFALVNANGVGGTEVISDLQLPVLDTRGASETWYVRVTTPDGGTFADIQMYNITITTDGGGSTTSPVDLTGDGCVDSVDLAVLIAAWGTPGADVTGDGTTNSVDLAVLLAAWTGSDCLDE